MSRRTDRYPIRTSSPEERRRMTDPPCDQVHPAEALVPLRRGLLVFGLMPDMTWRRVSDIRSHRPLLGPLSYEIVFAPLTAAKTLYPDYSRIFTPDGILLVENPKDPVTSDQGSTHARED